ncbi:MAG: cyclic nucleotide-binding domain-containing protein [Erysipelotrichaceae bacterium]|nr:cyclic nucleotide-binding domain-containing protein [Erysipelotrichaceae bacterium]
MKEIRDDKRKQRILDSPGFRRYFTDRYDPFASLYRADQGEKILRQEEESHRIYYLVSGRCKVTFLQPNGKSVLLNILVPGDLIGEIELLEDIRCFSVDALEDLILISLRKDDVTALLNEDPHFLRELSRSISRKERNDIYRLLHALTYPLENRLAKFILDYAEGDRFSIRKTIISESLCVSYRHTEKVMKDFTDQGILDKKKRIYRILNRDALERLSRELENSI